MADLKVGLVGAGMVSQYHIAGWQACPDARLVAIVDPDSAKAQARAGPLGIPAFRSLADTAGKFELDAVDIVAPVQAHGPLIEEALNRGLAVMCQKPLMPCAASARQLIARLPADARVMVHENWRWRRPYRRLKAALSDGRLPRPHHFEMRVESAGLLQDAQGRYPALERQPFFAGLDRLIVFELLIHHLDTLEFLLGPLEIASASLARRCPAVRGEDHADIGLIAGGVPGRLIGDMCVVGGPPTPQDRLQLDGPESALLADWTISIADEDPDVTDPETGYQQSYSDTIRHFAACLRSGTHFETSAADGLRLLETVETIYTQNDCMGD